MAPVTRRLRVIAGGAALTAVAVLAAVYASDDLFVRYRMAHRPARDPLDTVTTYTATELKNRRLVIFYDDPHPEVCVRALFPHLGYAPCWYVRRHTVRLVSGAGGPSREPARGVCQIEEDERPADRA